MGLALLLATQGASWVVLRSSCRGTGWSSEPGYELYLGDGSRGDELWERIMAAGEALPGLKPGHTSSIRRIEGGMLSYRTRCGHHHEPL